MTTTLITVAPTGAESRKSDVPALPVTLDELVDTARECEAVGAGGAVTDPEADRLRVLEAQPDMASCTMGTVNFGDDVFLNRWAFVVELHTRMQERGIVPEYEIFDLGQLATLRRLLDRHGLPAGGHVHVDLVMGVPGGMPGTVAALAACEAAMRDLPEGTTFSATGIGRSSLPVLLASLAAGGHLRVGLEDTVTYAKGQPVQSNAQLVARASGFARLAQRPPMAPADARTLLGIADV
jgi:3-keto-5-aminohexanoate cleavage enzyme